MKKLISYLSVILFVLFLGINVKANSINSIKMDVYIDSYGNAHVTEVWDTYLDEGTEVYRAYTDLEGAYISDFKVSDEVREYTTTSYWNTSASFNEKAYKAGINKISDGVELCFGISEYGSNIYTLSYTINGFVFEANDADVVYWKFINEDLASLTDNVYIKIYADHSFSDDLDVWGFGNYGGGAYVYDGYIEISNDSLNSDEYMVGLIKFPKDTFNTNNIKNNDFNYYLEMAKEGARRYIDWGAIFSFISSMFIFIVTFVGIIIASKNVQNVTEKHGTPNLSMWTMCIVEIDEEKVESVVLRLSSAIDDSGVNGTWYTDLKCEDFHYIIYPRKVFRVDRTKPEQYEEAKEYGLAQGIPEYQLPNRYWAKVQ